MLPKLWSDLHHTGPFLACKYASAVRGLEGAVTSFFGPSSGGLTGSFEAAKGRGDLKRLFRPGH